MKKTINIIIHFFASLLYARKLTNNSVWFCWLAWQLDESLIKIYNIFKGILAYNKATVSVLRWKTILLKNTHTCWKEIESTVPSDINCAYH